MLELSFAKKPVDDSESQNIGGAGIPLDINRAAILMDVTDNDVTIGNDIRRRNQGIGIGGPRGRSGPHNHTLRLVGILNCQGSGRHDGAWFGRRVRLRRAGHDIGDQWGAPRDPGGKGRGTYIDGCWRNSTPQIFIFVSILAHLHFDFGDDISGF